MLQRPRKGSLADKASTFFVEEIQDDKTHKCIIGNCSKRLVGTKNHNLVSHIKCMHADIYAKFINPQRDAKYYAKMRLRFIQNCVEIIAVNGRPFSYLNDSGFLQIIQEKLDELKDAGYGVELHTNNYEEIKANIRQLSNKIDNEIKLELKGRYFAIMLDIAKKNNISFLGISAEFIINDTITIRSIGMNEIKGAHSAQNIKDMLINCLTKFGVTMRQVISVTTDNGTNLLAMVNLLNEEEAAVLSNDGDLNDDVQEASETQGANSSTQADVRTGEDVRTSNF
jgi:hypothetical protein